MSRFNRPALLLIDIQKGFDQLDYWGGERNNPDAEQYAAKLLDHWRESGLPVFHIKHCSTNPTSLLHETNPGNEIKAVVKPLSGETTLKKQVNSAFIGTPLQQKLNDLGIQQLVIVGLTTDHCISTTARMAGNLGFDTYVVSDATATFCKTGLNGEHFPASLMHQTALASLNEEFATVLTTSEILKLL